MDHQLRLRTSGHAGAGAPARVARLDGAITKNIRGYPARRDRPAGTLAGPSPPSSGVSAGYVCDRRRALHQRTSAATENTSEGYDSVASHRVNSLLDDATPGDDPVQRNAPAAFAARHPQGAGADAARICGIFAGRESLR